MLALRLAEAGRLPDWVTRAAIRAELRRRLERSVPEDVEAQADALRRVVRALDGAPDAGPDAPGRDAAPEEPPAAFLELVTGRHLALGCGLFEREDMTLDEAEAAMLERCCARAEIDDGMHILDLGCGWGSLSLWMAQHYPSSRITAAGASPAQKAFVDARARARGLGNLEVLTGGVAGFDRDARFDRVLSVEALRRPRDWRAVLERAARWLDSGGKLFLQLACHRQVPYPCDGDGDHDWVAAPFAPGALVPSADLALHLQHPLRLEQLYLVSGRHYAATAEAWLANLDRRSGEALDVLAAGAARQSPRERLRRWRLRFLACAERFAFRGGNEWLVGHYRLVRP